MSSSDATWQILEPVAIKLRELTDSQDRGKALKNKQCNFKISLNNLWRAASIGVMWSLLSDLLSGSSVLCKLCFCCWKPARVTSRLPLPLWLYRPLRLPSQQQQQQQLHFSSFDQAKTCFLPFNLRRVSLCLSPDSRDCCLNAHSSIKTMKISTQLPLTFSLSRWNGSKAWNSMSKGATVSPFSCLNWCFWIWSQDVSLTICRITFTVKVVRGWSWRGNAWD